MTGKNASLTKDYYDKRFGGQSQRLNEEESIRWTAIENIVKKTTRSHQVRIADFGCGRGWLANKLSQYGFVTGFDISEKSIQNAKNSFSEIQFHCLDASGEIPPHFHKSFDLVISSEVIEHIQDQETYIKNFSELLKPGGQFILTTPNGKWFHDLYTSERESWKQPIEKWLTEQQLRNLFDQCGLQTENITSFNSEWLYDIRPKRFVIIGNSLSRKLAKALQIYPLFIMLFNKKKYGLNLIAFGSK